MGLTAPYEDTFTPVFTAALFTTAKTRRRRRQVASVVSDSVRPHRRQPTRLPRSWGSPGKNTGVGCHLLLQTQGSNPCLLHWQADSLPRSQQGNPTVEYYSAIKKNKITPFTATRMQLEIIILREIKKRKTNAIWYYLYVESKL